MKIPIFHEHRDFASMSEGMHWGGLFSSFRILLRHVDFLALWVENGSDFKKAIRLGKHLCT
jgi:hypothetical protein